MLKTTPLPHTQQSPPTLLTHTYIPPHLFAFFLCFLFLLSCFSHITLLSIFSISFHLSFFLASSVSLLPPPLYALNPLWISSYKHWINPSPPCVNGLLNIRPCLWICRQHLHWMWDWVSCLLATRRRINIDLRVLLSALVHILWKWLVGRQSWMFVRMHLCMYCMCRDMWKMTCSPSDLRKWPLSCHFLTQCKCRSSDYLYNTAQFWPQM